MKNFLFFEDEERDRFSLSVDVPDESPDVAMAFDSHSAPSLGGASGGGLFVLPPAIDLAVDTPTSDITLSPLSSDDENGPASLIEAIGGGRPVEYIVTTGNSTTTVFEDGSSESVKHLLGPDVPFTIAGAPDSGPAIDWAATTGNSTTIVYQDGSSEQHVHLLGPDAPFTIAGPPESGPAIEWAATTGNSTTIVYEDGTSEHHVHLLGPDGPEDGASPLKLEEVLGEYDLFGPSEFESAPDAATPDSVHALGISAAPAVRLEETEVLPSDILA